MSAALASPIFAEDVGKASLRFFRSPAPGPDLPWHVHDDLIACLGLPRAVRRKFHVMLANGPFKADCRVVATGDLPPVAAFEFTIAAFKNSGAHS